MKNTLIIPVLMKAYRIKKSNFEKIVRNLHNFNKSINEIRSIGRSDIENFFVQFFDDSFLSLNKIKESLEILEEDCGCCMPSDNYKIMTMPIPESWKIAKRVNSKKGKFISKNKDENKEYFLVEKKNIDKLYSLLYEINFNLDWIQSKFKESEKKAYMYLFDSKDFDIQARISQLLNFLRNNTKYPSDWGIPSNYFKIESHMLSKEKLAADYKRLIEANKLMDQ